MDLVDYYNQMEDQGVILYYKGPFDKSVLNKISLYIRHKFSGQSRLQKKVFAVFMELAQNIAYYSAEHNFFGHEEEKGVGTVAIYQTDDGVIVKTGNLVPTSEVEGLIDKCQNLNELSLEELRALKREVRNRPREEDQKGGNIGLIQIMLKSENPLVVKTQKIDEDHTYFILRTDINYDKGA